MAHSFITCLWWIENVNRYLVQVTNLPLTVLRHGNSEIKLSLNINICTEYINYSVYVLWQAYPISISHTLPCFLLTSLVGGLVTWCRSPSGPWATVKLALIPSDQPRKEQRRLFSLVTQTKGLWLFLLTHVQLHIYFDQHGLNVCVSLTNLSTGFLPDFKSLTYLFLEHLLYFLL